MVQLGQIVHPGTQIGKLGTSGNSTGLHLHFEVRLNGLSTDPMPYLGGEITNLNQSQFERYCKLTGSGGEDEFSGYPHLERQEAQNLLDEFVDKQIDSKRTQFQGELQEWCGIWWQDLGDIYMQDDSLWGFLIKDGFANTAHETIVIDYDTIVDFDVDWDWGDTSFDTPEHTWVVEDFGRLISNKHPLSGRLLNLDDLEEHKNWQDNVHETGSEAKMRMDQDKTGEDGKDRRLVYLTCQEAGRNVLIGTSFWDKIPDFLTVSSQPPPPPAKATLVYTKLTFGYKKSIVFTHLHQL